jgi:hypothetical protein
MLKVAYIVIVCAILFNICLSANSIDINLSVPDGRVKEIIWCGISENSADN